MGANERPLAGTTMLVTGATSGIGLETARELAARGATIVVGARDAARGRAVVEEIASQGGRAELLELDLASFASVRAAAERFLATHPKLDVLVNNAGVAVPARTATPDGHELTWQTNFLGPFLLTKLLLPALRRSPSPRVVNVSSEAHRVGRVDFENLELERNWKRFRAYANSKVAMNLFTRELARREPAVAANAVHPGTIATRIWRSVSAPVRALLAAVLPSARKGARPVVRLASGDVPGPGGRYFDKEREVAPTRASWDPAAAARLWEEAEKAVRGSTYEVLR